MFDLGFQYITIPMVSTSDVIFVCIYRETLMEVPLNIVLRTPVELWVSCGENFINPDIAEKLAAKASQNQANRNAENLVLDTEKHVLRQMTGKEIRTLIDTFLYDKDIA